MGAITDEKGLKNLQNIGKEIGVIIDSSMSNKVLKEEIINKLNILFKN